MALQDLVPVYLYNLIFPSVQQTHHSFMLAAFADISPFSRMFFLLFTWLVTAYSLKLNSNVRNLSRSFPFPSNYGQSWGSL